MTHPAIEWRGCVLGDVDHGLSSNARLVACAFAQHVGQDGVAWPGPARLARRTGLSASSVKRALAELEESGWLVVVKRGGGKEPTKRRIHTPCHTDTAPRVTQTRGEGHSDTAPVSERHAPRVTVTPELDQELDQELGEPGGQASVDDDAVPIVDPLEDHFLAAGDAGIAQARAELDRVRAS